jgi:hypothetical protein
VSEQLCRARDANSLTSYLHAPAVPQSQPFIVFGYGDLFRVDKMHDSNQNPPLLWTLASPDASTLGDPDAGEEFDVDLLRKRLVEATVALIPIVFDEVRRSDVRIACVVYNFDQHVSAVPGQPTEGQRHPRREGTTLR